MGKMILGLNDNEREAMNTICGILHSIEPHLRGYELTNEDSGEIINGNEIARVLGVLTGLRDGGEWDVQATSYTPRSPRMSDNHWTSSAWEEDCLWDEEEEDDCPKGCCHRNNLKDLNDLAILDAIAEILRENR